jgi:hypothetical protein
MTRRRRPGPHVVRRRLGAGLRALREQQNLRIESAARELECSPAKISRLENGIGPAKLWDVRILLALYGVTDEATRSQYEDWARDTKSTSWWESDSDLTSDDNDRFFAAETEAARISAYCTPVLPAQLQTLDYATAHLRALLPSWSLADIKRFAAVRHARQAPLLQVEEPLRFEAVVDEAALRRRVGSVEVHAAQLIWLADLLDELAARGRDHLTVRVVPFSAGPGRGLSPFFLFEPRNAALDPLSAYVEDTIGGLWLEADEVAPLRDIYDELVVMSIDPPGSRLLLREIIASL